MKIFTVSDCDIALLEIEKVALHKHMTRDFLFGLLAFVVVTSVSVFILDHTWRAFGVIVAVSVAGWYSTRTKFLLRFEAAKRRRDLELATAVFLELVNVMIAGGAGVETAVKASAEAGDGSGFSLLKVAVMRAHSSRTSYWDSLASLGHETGVECLTEVAHTMQLAGENGARVRSSLIAKAAALRTRNLARIEQAAEESTEKMGLPLVVLFIGFLGLVGFPAFNQALTTL